MTFKTLTMTLAVALGACSAYASGIEILEDNYATFQRVCFADGQSYEDIDFQGRFKEREDNQVCNFVTPNGDLYSNSDAQYKMIVNWVTPNQEDTWDELALFYNNSILRFGDRGMPLWAWDGFKVLKDSSGVFALIAKRSAFAEKDHHFIVVYLNEDKSCRVKVEKRDQFQNLNAFKSETKALEVAMALRLRKNVSCELRAEYIH